MTRPLQMLALIWLLLSPASSAAVSHDHPPSYPLLGDGSTQHAVFPRPLETYPKVEGGMLETIKSRAAAEPFNIAASVIFLIAILHTFAAASFTKLSHRYEHEHEEELNVASGTACILTGFRKSPSKPPCSISSAKWRRSSGFGF